MADDAKISKLDAYVIVGPSAGSLAIAKLDVYTITLPRRKARTWGQVVPPPGMTTDQYLASLTG